MTYRIVERDGMYSPQMSYPVRGQHRWVSLKRDGYWADPDGWNIDPDDGEDVVVLMETREMAESAIMKAKTINGATP
jgi:hypothetical protein